MRFFLFALSVILFGCTSSYTEPSNELKSNVNTAKIDTEQEQIPESQKVYFFQHKILPEWTFTSEGRFFEDLVHGNLEKIKRAASDVISPTYAEQIKSEFYPKYNAAIIIFPTPKTFTNCFFVLIKKNDDNFKFYTYEKTLSFSENDPIKGVVGTWSEEESHSNLGGRTYYLASDFVKDITQ